MTTYGITGITGNFGQAALKKLLPLVAAENIVVLARNVDKANQLVPTDVQVRQGNYDDQTTLIESLKGIDKLLFISSQPGQKVDRQTQHLNLVDAAKQAGVQYIAYTSFPNAQHAQSSLALDHALTEKAILDASLDHSFLRNNWYLENELGTIKNALAGNPFTFSAGNGETGWALESDYAEAAIKVLISDSPKEVYEFAGSLHTYTELGTALQSASGTKFEIKSLTDQEYTAMLTTTGLDQTTAEVITSFQTLIRNGDLDVPSTDLADVLERKIDLNDEIKKLI